VTVATERRATDEVALRDIAPAAFLPPALFAIGQGAIAPVVVISATDLGASPAMAALVVATAGLGQIMAASRPDRWCNGTASGRR